MSVTNSSASAIEEATVPVGSAAAGDIKLCLICMSPCNNNGSSKSSFVSRVFEEEEATWNKLCSYWLLPPRSFKKTLDVCRDQQLCKGCTHSVKEAIKIQTQIESLEDKIKKKAYEMARLIDVSSRVMEDSPTKMLKAQDVWIKFKEPVIENYTKYMKPPPKAPTTITTTLPTTAIITYNVSNQEYYQEVEIHVESTTTVPPEPSDSDEDDDGDDNNIHPTNTRRLPLFGTVECSKCDFNVPFDQRSNAGEKFRTRSNAKNGINSHYTANHNPVKRSDVSSSGDSLGGEEDRFYQCTLCPFKSFVRQGPTPSDNRRLSARENDALHILSRHYIDTHDSPTAESEEQGQNDSSKVEGLDIFTCPVEGCGFIATTVSGSATKTQTRKVDNKRAALCKLGTHYLRTHEFPKSKILGKHPCLEIIAGKEGFKCPRCNFRAELSLEPVSLLTKSKTGNSFNEAVKRNRRVASMSFMRHYATHVYPM